MSHAEPVRLGKFLATAGVASRRAADKLIEEGRVQVDGAVVVTPGTKIDPGARVMVDGEGIRTPKRCYYMINKPPGVICTNAREETKTRAIDLVRSPVRVYPVGRLDEDSEGLLVLTNDGWLAHRLTHPSFGIAKVYRVKVRGRVHSNTLDKIREGVHLAEGKTAPAEIHVKRRGATMTTLEMILREGMNREIRRVFAAHEHSVYHLKRVRLGPLSLGKLPRGSSRVLTEREIRTLRESVGEKPGDVKPPAGRHKSRKQRGKRRSR